MKFRFVTASSVLAIAMAATPSFAQDSSGTDASYVGDDIVVTARRVEEKLQDIPVAVTAVSGDKLEQLGVSGPVDVRQVAVGLSVSNAAGRTYTPIYAIRGQRAGDQVFTQDPPVAVYLDDVYVSPIAGSNTGLFDLESVQVLKGPQGTLFGRNTTGGAVLYTSAKPEDSFSGKITTGIAKYGTWKLGGHVNLPVNDMIRLRAAFDYKKDRGYGEVRDTQVPIPGFGIALPSPETGKDTMGAEQYAGRLSVAIDPFDGVETLTIVSYSHYEDKGGPAFSILDTPRPFGPANLFFNFSYDDIATLSNPVYHGWLDQSIAERRSWGRYDYASGTLNGAESKVWTVSNTVSIELSDNLTLKNIFGYRHLDTWDAADYDGTWLPILQATNSARANTYSEELQLQGTGLDDKLDFIFGFYLFDQRGIEGTGTKFMKPENQSVGTVAFGGAPRLQYVRITNQSFSGFGQIGYHISDDVTFNAGFRYSVDRRRANSTVGTTVYGADGVSDPQTCEYTDAEGDPLPATHEDCRAGGKASFAEPSWLVGIDWKVDPDTLVYVASRHSYRSGVFQSRPFDNTTAALTASPEKVTDVEVGLKRDWDLGGDAGLRTNIAGYYQWYSDIQRNSSTLTPVGIGNVTRNAAKAHIMGLEFESELRLGQLARLSFNYAYVKPTYDSFPTQIYDPTIPGFVPQDRKGYKWPYIPRHQINANLIVTPDIGDFADLTMTLNGYYQSKVYFGDDYYNDATLEAITQGGPVSDDTFYAQKGYALLNGRIQLDNIGGTGFSAAAWIRNVFDKKYIDSGVLFADSIGFGTGIYGPPRTFGLDVSYEF